MAGRLTLPTVRLMTTLHFPSGDPDLAIETRGLTKLFGARAAVDAIDLQVPAGTAFGFLGPNGAGKTTMMRMLLGLTSVSAGDVRLLGLPQPGERAAALARIGAIIEEPRFHSHLTGRENLRIAAAVRSPEARGRIEGVLARVGLTDRGDDRLSTYSMGMRQRLGIARCLLSDPALLILDEPLNGVDPAGIIELRELFAELVAEGRTIVVSSHLLDEIEKTCDSVAIVDHGRLVAQGSIAELARPTSFAVIVGTDEPQRAAQILGAHRAVRTVTGEAQLRVELAAADAGAAVNRALVEAGIGVYRFEPERISLEARFLQVTSRLGEAA
jgi:ABC-2 type transport system ATP-binding protein